MKGLLLKIIAGFCYVEAGNTVYECKPRGSIKRNNGVLLAGDIVEISVPANSYAVVESVYKRKNSFVRPPVANLNRLFIISSHNTPSPNAMLIDRISVIAAAKGVEPVIVFNKSDLGDFEYWKKLYERAGLKTFVVSAKDNTGIKELKEYLYTTNGIAAFTGNSGVGKSSILNAIVPELNIETGDVSQKLGRGRHTTRKVEIYRLSDKTLVADTPGFSSLDIEKYEMIKKDELEYSFSEFKPFLGKCKFTSCSHTGEKGCEILNAVQSGIISESRYESYKSLYNEVKDIKEWNLKK